MSLIPKTSFLVGTFFVASYNKTDLVQCTTGTLGLGQHIIVIAKN